ncbi:hypothetical protein VNI00_008451 [Paramarasmius palmivorus]|uniref:Uncharacterized protein n=1 Tax=Paramarasmius palmivorus TaxID=297713 RepID=A0AAW0CWM2_9AGAR
MTPLDEALQECITEIDGYGRELKRLQDTVRQMKKRKEYLSDIANRLKEMLKPSIRRLPPEILLHVFYIAWEDAQRTQVDGVVDNRKLG